MLQEELRAVYAEPLPETTATIALPLTALQALPEGVEVCRHQGRTRARVVRKGDTLTVQAVSDSVLRMVTVYGESRRVERKEQQCHWKWLLAGMLLLVVWRNVSSPRRDNV